MSKLRTAKEDKIDTRIIIENSKKVVEFKEFEKIRHQAKEQMREQANFKPVNVPIMQFGSHEERLFFKNLLGYKKAI